MKLKKVLTTAVLGAIVFVCGHFNAASAQDVWFETDSYDNKWYVRTESIKQVKGTTIKFDSVRVRPSGKYNITHEEFRYIMSTWSCKPKKNYWTPVWNDAHYERMFEVVRNYLGI